MIPLKIDREVLDKAFYSIKRFLYKNYMTQPQFDKNFFYVLVGPRLLTTK